MVVGALVHWQFKSGCLLVHWCTDSLSQGGCSCTGVLTVTVRVAVGALVYWQSHSGWLLVHCCTDSLSQFGSWFHVSSFILFVAFNNLMTINLGS